MRLLLHTMVTYNDQKRAAQGGTYNTRTPRHDLPAFPRTDSKYEEVSFRVIWRAHHTEKK